MHNNRQIILQAIAERKLLLFTYNGKNRKVEPHKLALTTKNNVCLSAFDVNELMWKKFLVNDIERLEISRDVFPVNRQGFHPGASQQFPAVFAEVDRGRI